MQDQIKNLLHHHQLRHTACREDTLSLFFKEEFALSHADLEKELSPTYDRVTLYRTLNAFQDAGILHKVLDDQGVSKYALCSAACEYGHHNHEHVHFKCLRCGQTQCVDNVKVPDIQLPKGFEYEEANLLIQGVCPQCHA